MLVLSENALQVWATVNAAYKYRLVAGRFKPLGELKGDQAAEAIT